MARMIKKTIHTSRSGRSQDQTDTFEKRKQNTLTRNKNKTMRQYSPILCRCFRVLLMVQTRDRTAKQNIVLLLFIIMTVFPAPCLRSS